jgi:hypothetical protein
MKNNRPIAVWISIAAASLACPLQTGNSSPAPAESPTGFPTNTAVPTATATSAPSRTPAGAAVPTLTSIPFRWEALSAGENLLRDRVLSFAADPGRPEVMYLGLENSGVYKSYDGGRTWRPLRAGLEKPNITPVDGGSGRFADAVRRHGLVVLPVWQRPDL